MSNVVGLNPSTVRIYVPKCDRDLPEEEQLKFKVRMLRARESAKFRDEIYEIKGLGKKRTERLRSGSHELRVLYACLEGWENFTDEDGKEIEFKKRKGSEGDIIDNVDFIPDEIRAELARYCSRENEIDEEEEKS